MLYHVQETDGKNVSTILVCFENRGTASRWIAVPEPESRQGIEDIARGLCALWQGDLTQMHQTREIVIAWIGQTPDMPIQGITAAVDCDTEAMGDEDNGAAATVE